MKELKEVDCYICNEVNEDNPRSCNLDICLYQEENKVIKNFYCNTCEDMSVEKDGKQYCNNDKCNIMELEKEFGHVLDSAAYSLTEMLYGEDY